MVHAGRNPKDFVHDALVKIGAPAVPMLTDAVFVPRSMMVNTMALSILAKIGPAAKSAVPDLKQFQNYQLQGIDREENIKFLKETIDAIEKAAAPK
jgi:hypothetical protein